MDSKRSLVCTFAIFVGVIFMALSYSAYQAEERFDAEGIHVPGSISGSEGDPSGHKFRPVYKFKTKELQEISFTTGSTMSTHPYEIGSPVEVVYDPKDPHRAEVAHSGQDFVAPFGIVGLLVVLIAAFVLISYRKRPE